MEDGARTRLLAAGAISLFLAGAVTALSVAAVRERPPWAIVARAEAPMDVTPSWRVVPGTPLDDGADGDGHHSRVLLEPSGVVDPSAVMVAELVVLALRRHGSSGLDRIARTAGAHAQVVTARGRLHALRYEDGLFVGELVLAGGDRVHVITPLAAAAIEAGAPAAFRGVLLRVDEALARSPNPFAGSVLIGAFEPR